MNKLRLEADESSAKAEEFQSKVKPLEQENLAKEQEITSLSHKNGLLESEVEKLEKQVSDLKKAADDGQQHGTQNETLTRRLQLLEEEAEEADKTLREANEKYDSPAQPSTTIKRICADCISLQAAPDRRQGRTLRAQSPGSRDRARHVGVKVRRDGQEVCPGPEGARGVPAGDWQHLSWPAQPLRTEYAVTWVRTRPNAGLLLCLSTALPRHIL